jgi:SAM-dependent methyltransferase
MNAVPNKDKIMARLTQGSTDLLRTWAEAIRGDAEEAAPAETPEVQERRASLHARRHEVILRHIPETQSGQAARSLRVVDLGCGDGKLTVKILKERPGSKVLAIDADAMNLEWLFRNVRRAFKRPRVAVDTETTKTVAPGDLVAESADGESPVLSVELGRGVTAFVAGATREELTEPSIKSRYKDRQDNIVLPEVEDHDRDPDVLVLSEVIEHLLPEDRAKLIENVATLWRAKKVILTTPNVAYNHVWGIPDGTLRHRDHKVEYDYKGLWEEVVDPLQKRGYVVQLVPLLTKEDAGGPHTLVSHVDGRDGGEGVNWDALIQPSWVVVADLREDATPERTYKPVYEAREAHASVHLHESGYTVRHGEMTVGLCHPVYLGHRTGLAWLAPTVPPVEHLETEPGYLEHPMAAFRYYDERGVRELVAEVKYMGSRMTVVAFADRRVAALFGYAFVAEEAPLFAWSRQGYPFFDDRAMGLRLHESLRRGGFFVERDVVVLDGEFMPWSFKAGQGDRNLITQAFQTPGEVARIDARFKGDAARVERADRFLRTLKAHSAEASPAFVPFDVKLTGRVKEGQRWLDNPRLGMRTRAHMLRWLEERVEQSRQGGYDSLLQACEWHPVYLENQTADTVDHSIDLWKAYCAAGGEGFVYKPMRPETLLDGAPVQAALKVRGRDYLRLIYGMNYLEPAFFARVARRNVAAKRRLALQENLLAERILRAFMRGERRERDRYIAAFLGCDGVEGKSIDATL